MADPLKKMPVQNVDNLKVPIETSTHNPFEMMRRQFEHLFQDFAMPSLFHRRSRFDVDPFWGNDVGMLQAPLVDIVESDKDYEISAEVPGVDEKQLSVRIVNDTIQIKGEKQEQREDKSGSFHLTERRYGAFERSFLLPQTVDPSSVTAKFKNGVLKVTLPKKEEAMTPQKDINITTD